MLTDEKTKEKLVKTIIPGFESLPPAGQELVLAYAAGYAAAMARISEKGKEAVR